MDPQLKQQCSSTIYVANRNSVDNYGDPSYAAPTAMAARVEKIEVIKNSTGDGGGMQKKETKTKLYTEDEIFVDDMVWLPGLDQNDLNKGQTPENVSKFRTERGAVDHFETIL